MPVAILDLPVPSRLTVTLICVSLVLRCLLAVRISLPKGHRLVSLHEAVVARHCLGRPDMRKARGATARSQTAYQR